MKNASYRKNHGRPPDLKNFKVVCGPTGKVCFKSEGAALQRSNEFNECEQKTFRVYHCSYCGKFHLTSKEKIDFQQQNTTKKFVKTGEI